MGELYRKMERDLAIKNLAPVTRKEYLRCCCKFVRYHMRSPREMGVSEIKDFLRQLVREGAGPETLKMHVAGVKFLYGITLDRQQVADKIPWPKVPHKQPDILSLSEVERLLAAGAQSLIPSMVAMTANSEAPRGPLPGAAASSLVRACRRLRRAQRSRLP
jgi:site-specific recombinase XerD